jgi:hypothetical protein
MKYLILVLGLVFCTYSYCQTQAPDLVIPIQFTFQLGGGPINMQVGLDSTATDCLDLQIGESELPPIPPPGWEAVIYLPYPQCQGSFGDPIMVHKDFRFGELPFTGTKTHKFRFRPDLGVTIYWNLPNGVTGLLKDVLTGGNIINYPMAGQDSFYVIYNYIDEINMILNYDIVSTQSSVSLNNGWNLLSVPLVASDMTGTTLFPTAISPFYYYNAGYNQVTTLENGKGYWAKFDGSQSVTITGNYVSGNEISVVQGWNLIGHFAYNVVVSGITTSPPNILSSPFYGYEGGYIIPTTLLPGKGYWIKANQNGVIQLNTGLRE